MKTRKKNCTIYVTGMKETDGEYKFCSNGGFSKETWENDGVPYSNICTMNVKQLAEYLQKDQTPISDFLDMMNEIFETDFEYLNVFFYDKVNHKDRLSHVLHIYRNADNVPHFYVSGRIAYLWDLYKHMNFENPYVLTILNDAEIL